jgi:hypothetical protein
MFERTRRSNARHRHEKTKKKQHKQHTTRARKPKKRSATKHHQNRIKLCEDLAPLSVELVPLDCEELPPLDFEELPPLRDMQP